MIVSLSNDCMAHNQSSTRMHECSKRVDGLACMSALYVCAQSMDEYRLCTCMGSTLWAWYACSKLLIVPWYARMLPTRFARLYFICPSLVLVCLPAALLVARCPCPSVLAFLVLVCLSAAGLVARFPCASVFKLLLLP